MSENEDDIWGYKSFRKKKSADRSVEKTESNVRTRKAGVKTKRKAAKKTSGAARKTTGAKNTKPPGENGNVTSPAKGHTNSSPGTGSEDLSTPKRTDGKKTASPSTPKAKHGGYCPSCQMPFSILLVQTPRWHVSECLDTPSSAQTECPDGLSCSSTIASHYKRYAHFLLARSRASALSPFPPTFAPDLPSPDTTKSRASNGRNDTRRSHPQGGSPAFPKKTMNVKSSQSRSPASSQGSVKQTSMDAWLSSPAKMSQVSPDLSQEIPSQGSARCAKAATFLGLSQMDEDLNDRAISYSPLVSDQELFSDDEGHEADPVEKLFSDKLSAEDIEEHLPAYEHFITQRRIESPTECNRNNESAIQNESVQSNGGTCVADNWSECSTPASEISGRATTQVEAECWIQEEADELLVSSNGNRESALLTVPVAAVKAEEEFCMSTQRSSQQFTASRTHAKQSLTQLSPVMPPGGAASSKEMKQMDIGVFFGLKPKSSQRAKVPLKSRSPNADASQIGEKWQRRRKNVGSLGDVHYLSDNAGGVPATAPSGTQRRKRKAVGSLSDADSLIHNTGGVSATAPSGTQRRKRKAVGSLSDADSLIHNTGEVSATAPSGTQRREWKRFRQNSTTEEKKGRKQCPFYKKIPGTGFAVDAFQYGAIEGCSAYFLTHFHSDHYGGLTKKFRNPIYCSKITGNLVASKLRVEKEFIKTLPMDTECIVGNVKVILLDANHCPGAVLLLFILPNGTTVLHTGDFRADTSMERYPALIGRRIHTLYLDTTYCSPEYTFPPQQEAVQFAVNAAFEMMTLYPRTLVVCGTYSVGKEKVFLAIADVLGCKVCMSPDKYKTMQCLESDEIRALVTSDWQSSALHVLPMMQVNFKGLGAHLSKFAGKYDRVLAFKPTGWTYSDGCSSVHDIRPQIRGKITIYGIPYSEHSSYLEMKRFVQFTKPQKIIPTVNVGNWQARAAMEKYFAEWLLEARFK